MVNQIVPSVVGVVKLLNVPVRRYIGYARNWNENVANLKSVLDQLKLSESSLQGRATTLKLQGGKIEEEAELWLEKAHDFFDKADKFLKDESIAKKKFLAGLCPHWNARYHQDQKAKEMLDFAKGLMVQKENMDIKLISDHEPPRVVAPVKGFQVFESRKSVFNEIMEALQDPNVTKVGIFGITGVGKTTLVKEIAAQAQRNKLFDEVAMATAFQGHNMREMQGEEIVKETPDVRRIQEEIKDELPGFEFLTGTERQRAKELSERLKDERRRRLVVLDNIWAGLELQEVGIPSNHDKCKILMTSKSEIVLHLMGSEKNFSLGVLEKDEATDFFNKLVGGATSQPGLKQISRQVADRCEGLPFSLVKVARGLSKKRDLSSWKHALNRQSGDSNLPLRLSYNLLGTNETKKLFLLCAQLPPGNILVKNLLSYCWAMGWFENCKTLEQTRNRLLKSVDDLKASSLLLEVSKNEVLKMRDIVHNFAVSLSSKDHNIFTAAYGNEVGKWPTKDELEWCTAISLPDCKIPKLQEFECPELESFILMCKDPSTEIPDRFFEKMEKMRVLDLTNMQFSLLPSSLDLLTEIKTLCLHFCILEKTVNMAIIGKLKKLEILSFWGSDIVQLPTEIAQLTRLRLLDLNDCQRLEEIPPTLFSCLTKMEEFYMENCRPVQWGIIGQQSGTTNLAKWELLSNLTTLDIHISDANILPESSSFDMLERFRIFIGHGWSWSGEYPTSKTLKLKLNSYNKLSKAVKALVRRTEDLYVEELKGVESSLYELDIDGQGFPQLKHLHVENCQEIQYIIKADNYSAFTRLESLSLYNLKNLERISCGQLLDKSFGNLKMLKVRNCVML